MYEVQTANTFPLGPTENIAEAPRLQFVLWAPFNNHLLTNNNNGGSSSTSSGSSNGDTNGGSTSSSASSSLNTPTTPLPTPTASGSPLLNSLGGASVANLVKPPPPIQLQQQNQDGSSSTLTNGIPKAIAQNQAIAFVHENDIYYKPKVQGELVCRITTTGEFLIFCLSKSFNRSIFERTI